MFAALVLGERTMREHGLFPTPRGFNTVYDPNVDPTIKNVWGAAAFRFGHSQVKQ